MAVATLEKPRRPRVKHTRVVVRGFLRGQLVNGETGKIEGDTGWIENQLVNFGLNSLGTYLASVAGSSGINYACMATQAVAMNITQASLSGTTNAVRAVNITTSGTMTVTYTASFASSDLGASCSVAAAGLYYTNSGNASLFAGQTFSTSAWNTNQNFNLTYQLRFATA
jgi:hypothetical protein